MKNLVYNLFHHACYVIVEEYVRKRVHEVLYPEPMEPEEKEENE